jgi:hypothetical protein
MDPAQLDPNGDGGGRVVGSNSRRVDDTRVRLTATLGERLRGQPFLGAIQ